MPLEIVYAYAIIKKSCAKYNASKGRLDDAISKAIQDACDEIIAGKWDEMFPLVVFQTGSGTQSNMNVNEVVSNRAIQIMGGTVGSKNPVHPNDHVNMGQSSNDSFPTAMYVAVSRLINERTLGQLTSLYEVLDAKAKEFSKIVKIGRTHTQDATPLTL